MNTEAIEIEFSATISEEDAGTESKFATLVRKHFPHAVVYAEDDSVNSYFIADEMTETAISVSRGTRAEAWEDAWARIQNDGDTQDEQEAATTVETAPNAKPCDLEEGGDELHDAEIEQAENVATTNVVDAVTVVDDSVTVVDVAESTSTDDTAELPSLVSALASVPAVPSTATIETERDPAVDGAPEAPVIVTATSTAAPVQSAANRRILLTRIGYLRDDVAAKAVEISRAADAMKILKGELKDITKELSDDEAEYEQLYGHPAERDELGDDYDVEFDVPADAITGAASENETPSLVSTPAMSPAPTASSVGRINIPTVPPATPTTPPATDEAGNADLWVLYEHGLTKSQGEKLRDDLSIRTIRDLETFMRAGNLTPAKMKEVGIKGIGKEACAKISDAWAAYRRVHPVPEVSDAESLQSGVPRSVARLTDEQRESLKDPVAAMKAGVFVDRAEDSHEDPDDRGDNGRFIVAIPQQTPEQIAYRHGADAAADHLEISANPHRRGTAESIAWDRGYTEWEGE